MEPSLLQHLVILCCYGGVPFINYETADNSMALSSLEHHASGQRLLHPLDLTDWVAVDEPGQLLNATLHPELLDADHSHLAQLLPSKEEQALEVSAGGEPLSLEQCDLYNLTFSSFADEHLYHTMGGRLECRCPARRYGTACYLRKFRGTGGVTGRKALNKKRDLSPHLQTFTHPSPPINSILSYDVDPQRPLADELAELTLRERRENHSAVKAKANKFSSNGSDLTAVNQQMSPVGQDNIDNVTAGDMHAAHGQHHSFALYLVVMLVFMLAMAAVFTMMRGCCWVDCFGGFKMPFSSPSSRRTSHLADTPLDPAMLNRCLDAVRAHEENEKNKYATQNVIADARRPLISSVSENCPYQPTTIPANAVPADYYRPLPTEMISAGNQPPPRNPQYSPHTAAVDLPAAVYSFGVDQNRTRQQPSPPPSYKSLEI